MRTVLVLAAFIALASASVVPVKVGSFKGQTVAVEESTVHKQYKILELFEALSQVNTNAGYYKVGYKYNIKANIDKYEKKEVVEWFYKLWDKGFLQKYRLFSIFDEKMRTEAIALYKLFYYAKDFETFYNTAAWARIHVNEGMFAYSFYIATIHRTDTNDVALPAFYEIWPEFFTNAETFTRMLYTKMRGLPYEDFPEYGMVGEGDYYFYYANYSDYMSYGQDEYKLTYLTEDIGWNSYYTYFHGLVPFWEKGDDLFSGVFKERRGEYYYYFYQQLLARYYLERLTNGLGEIPTFSWYQPYQYGYYPYLTSNFFPFVQRPNNYVFNTHKNLDDLRFVRNYEDMFLSYLEKGKFKAYQQDVDFHNSKSVNFVGNFWQENPDLYEKAGHSNYYRSYEQSARRILGASPATYKDYTFFPTALDFYQTSLRDPAFYQLYNKIVSFMFQYKKYLQPYNQDTLHYVGVKVNHVEVSKLTTFFDIHTYNASNAIVWEEKEFSAPKKSYMVMKPRLNHEQFTVKINIKSDVDEMATFKIFIGPKFDGKGYPIKFEDNWMNFVQLDWFHHKLTKGENVIERGSDHFFHFKEDSQPIEEIYQLLAHKRLPVDMVENFNDMPKRLMLPRGTPCGFPFQFFVVVYPGEKLPKEYEPYANYLQGDKPLGYPLDRPVSDYFWQPNMYLVDTPVYHHGPQYPHSFDAIVEALKTL